MNFIVFIIESIINKIRLFVSKAAGLNLNVTCNLTLIRYCHNFITGDESLQHLSSCRRNRTDFQKV